MGEMGVSVVNEIYVESLIRFQYSPPASGVEYVNMSTQ